MSRLRRNPINFPKMKLRGRRNKARAAARFEHIMRLRVLPAVVEGGQSVTFVASAEGTHMIETRYAFDGFGRRVA
jgi:hypothetical protein